MFSKSVKMKLIITIFLFLPSLACSIEPITTISMLGSYGETIQGCDDLNRTSYLRSEGMRIQELPRNTVRAVSLNQCAKHCSSKSNAVDCHSFEYNAASQMCSLQSAQGQPFGPSIVANTNEPGISFFQQICIASEELCSAPYAFERFPQHILTGQALETFSTDGLSECLSLCLEAKRKLKLDCRSLMFYYETGECILNRETKKELPENFTNDTKFQLVDYFENNCYDVTCFGSAEIHWIRAEDFNIGIEKDVILNGLTADECKQACIENMVGAEMFPCKAFVYSSVKQECHLTAESGLTRKLSSAITSDDDTTSNRLNAELSAINAGQYYEKYCIEGPTKCKETSFELIPNRMINVFDKVIETKSVAHCLQQCLLMVENCTSVMFFKDKNECVLNKKSQYSDPELFTPAINVDYYDNICEYEAMTLPSTVTAPVKNAFSTDNETVVLSEQSIEQALHNFQEANKENKSDTRQKPVFQALREPVEKIKGTLATECRLDGIIITAHFEELTSGALFIKDHSSTCRKVFNDIIESQLEIPFPSSVDSNPDCPGIELAPNLWSFIVVIQKNNIGIPSLMTESDRIFNVTCDYSNTAVSSPQFDSNQQSEVFVTAKPNEDFIGKIKMSILRDGKPVTTVSLGEELELKWIIENFKNEGTQQKYGYFIDECVAERLDGQPPDPAPLRLIYQGCPDEKVRNRLMRYPIIEVEEGYSTHMKAFRFDGSRRVRIRCAVNICIDRCEPVTCEADRDFNSVLSFGKKRKKRQTIGDLQALLEKYHDAKLSGNVVLGEEPNERDDRSQGSTIEQSTITGIYTLIENQGEASQAKGTNASKSMVPMDPEAKPISPVETFDLLNLSKTLSPENKDESSTALYECIDLSDTSKPNHISLPRATFICIVIFLGLLSTIQLFTIVNCFYGRYNKYNSFIGENASIASTASLAHSGSTEFYSAYFNQMHGTGNDNQSEKLFYDRHKSITNNLVSSQKAHVVSDQLAATSLPFSEAESPHSHGRRAVPTSIPAVNVARYKL